MIAFKNRWFTAPRDSASPDLLQVKLPPVISGFLIKGTDISDTVVLAGCCILPRGAEAPQVFL